jgi:hypothetical protein
MTFIMALLSVMAGAAALGVFALAVALLASVWPKDRTDPWAEDDPWT